jgi:lipoate-protein ligase B
MISTLLRVFKLPRTSYQQIFSLQQQLRAARQANRVSDCLLLVEHDPVYTLGRHQNHANLLWPVSRIESELQVPVVRTDRGGDVTYHGPGVLCAYHVADLRALHCTVKGYVERLEAVMIRTALHYGVRAYGG